jgi:hypothetical protein
MACYRRVMQVFTHIPLDLNQDVEAVSAFYVASIGDLVGEGYHSPSLSSLASAWVRYPGAYPPIPRSCGT